MNIPLDQAFVLLSRAVAIKTENGAVIIPKLTHPNKSNCFMVLEYEYKNGHFYSEFHRQNNLSVEVNATEMNLIDDKNNKVVITLLIDWDLEDAFYDDMEMEYKSMEMEYKSMERYM